MQHLKIPILYLLTLLLTVSACTPAAPQNLTVLAASSLTEAFNELGRLFEDQHPGVKVNFSYAGSQQLVQQLDQKIDADVFASASPKSMDEVIKSGKVNLSDAKIFAGNRLVVIYPKGNPAGLKELKDLAKAGLKLDLADKSVPVGQYALDFLEKASQDPALGPSFKDRVLKNVVSYENNVKAVLTKVALGEVDAGIAYASDLTSEPSGKIEKIDIPDALNSLAAYPIAPIADSQNPSLARAFVALVLSPQGQAILARHGFLPPAAISSP